MRMLMLSIVAALGVATLTGPAMAQTAQASVRCPPGYQWVSRQYYNRWGEYEPGHCVFLNALGRS
jgi:hypothetical protein